MIGKFFHIPKARRFNINPRYYDPDQEERDARVQRIKSELGIIDEKVEGGKSYRPNIKGQFRDMGGWWSKTNPGARRTSNRRLIILIFILSLISYLIFFSDFNFI